MTSTLKRQLTDEEKEYVLRRDGRRCFATGHQIPDGDAVQFDHIYAFTKGGSSEIDNIAPMCELHNKQKSTLALADFRTKLRMNQFFAGGEPLTLKDLLDFLRKHGDIGDYGQPVDIAAQDGVVRILDPSGN